MTNECDRYQPLLAGAVDDELSDTQWADLEAHLVGCAKCQTQLKREQDTVLLLEGLAPQSTRHDLRSAITAATFEATIPGLSSRWPLTLVVGGTLAKVVDLFIAGEHSLLWRFCCLGIVLLAFVLAHENPFRFATDEELLAGHRKAMT